MEIVREAKYEETRVGTCLAQMQPGRPFRHINGEDVYIRLYSSDGGSLACVNLNNASIYYYRPSKRVVPVDVKLLHRGDL